MPTAHTMSSAGMDKFEWHRRVVSDPGIKTLPQLRTLLALWDFSDKHGRNVRPGRQLLIERSQVRKSSLDAALRFLVKQGYLVVRSEGGRGRGGRGLATVYELGVPALWITQETSQPTGVFSGETSQDFAETSQDSALNLPTGWDPSEEHQKNRPSSSAHPPADALHSTATGTDDDGNPCDWDLSTPTPRLPRYADEYDWGQPA